jgi:hypothetical protein
MQNLRLLATLIIVMMCTVTYAQTTRVSTLGGVISKETGLQWIENYKQERQASSEHFCSREMLREIFSSAGASGVYLIKGIDNTGNERLIVKATNENGDILKDSKSVLTEVKAVSDVNSAGFVLDDVMTKPMIDKFQDVQKKNEFAGHVYGKKVFDDLLSQPGACGVYITKGLDEQSEEHLVLAALDKEGKVMWNATIWNHGSGIFSIIFPIVIAVAAR